MSIIKIAEPNIVNIIDNQEENIKELERKLKKIQKEAKVARWKSARRNK